MDKFDAEVPGEIKRRIRWQQYLAASLATLGAMCDGAVLGWTAPVLPVLQHHSFEPMHDNFTTAAPISNAEASWIGALVPLGALLGALPAGYIADAVGRKRLLLVLGGLFFLGWLLIIVAKESVPLLYTSRLVSGLAAGGVTVVIPLYNEEIAEDDIRGALGTYLDLMLAVGILWSYVIGAFLPYFWFSLISCALPLLFCATFVFMPESPVHLLAKGRPAKAQRALRWLRGADALPDYDVGPELRLMQKFIDESACDLPPRVTKKSATVALGEFFSSVALGTPTSKACTAVFGLMMLQQLSGVDAILFYTVDIFQETGSSLSPLVATVVAGVIQVVATYASSLLVDRVGRRFLLILSGAVMAASHAVLAVYLAVRDLGYDVQPYGWLPLVAVNVFLVFFAIGLGPLPWFMMAELLPLDAKKWASGVAVCLNWTLSFVVTKWFSKLTSELGSKVTYVIFCVICVLIVVFVAFLVPETKGKSKEEIQRELGAPVYIARC